jgi:hypothetical protein
MPAFPLRQQCCAAVRPSRAHRAAWAGPSREPRCEGAQPRAVPTPCPCVPVYAPREAKFLDPLLNDGDGGGCAHQAAGFLFLWTQAISWSSVRRLSRTSSAICHLFAGGYRRTSMSLYKPEAMPLLSDV